jgi:hypothetical protein
VGHPQTRRSGPGGRGGRASAPENRLSPTPAPPPARCGLRRGGPG